MTATTGNDPHPEVTEIADFSEGLLPPERGAQVREHLAGCAVCADVLASLEEIHALLGTLPGPPRMPADVAGRIDAALAAEALLDSTLPEPDRPDRLDRPDRSDASRRDVPRGTSPLEPAATPAATPAASARTSPDADAPADAAAKADTDAYTGRGSVDVPRGTSTAGSRADSGHVSRETSSAPSGHPSAATGPGRSGPSAGRRTGRRRGRAAIIGAYAAAVLVLGGAVYGVVSAGGGHDTASSDSSTSLDSAREKGGAVLPDTIEDKVHALLAGSASTGDGRTAVGGPSHENTPMLTQNTEHPDVAPARPLAVPSCVLKATQRAQAPLAADREVYRGARAYLLVLPHSGDDAQVDAFLVNASCTASSPGAVLFQATYPR